MDTPPVVRLVVLNYNGGALVQRCLDHLEALAWPAERLQIVVVDNDSQDGSDLAIEQRARVRLVRSPSNVGFPGNNLALRDLDGVDFVGLVNNDAFVEPDYLAPLVEALVADPGLGAACPKILLATSFADLELVTPPWSAPGDGRELGVRLSGLEVDGEDRFGDAGFLGGVHALEAGARGEAPFRWTAGRAAVRVPLPARDAEVLVRLRLAADRSTPVTVRFAGVEVAAEVGERPEWVEVRALAAGYDVVNNAGSLLIEGGWGADRGFLERDRGQYDEPAEVFAWCGGAVLFPSRYLADAGLFDERFFMYYEDTDLAWRGRARGWRYAYVPTSVVRHVHAATSGEGSPMFQHYVERNRLVMLTKNAPASMAGRAVLRFVTATGSYGLRDVVRPVLRRRRPALGLVRARVRSFLAYLRLLPALIRDRRRLRAGQVVPDAELVAWAVPQPGPPS